MSGRYHNFVKYATIRVTNSKTKAVYEHGRVPIEHVEMLKMNPCLKVEVLGATEFRPKRDSVNEETT
jgi:hypothetical protein